MQLSPFPSFLASDATRDASFSYAAPTAYSIPPAQRTTGPNWVGDTQGSAIERLTWVSPRDLEKQPYVRSPQRVSSVFQKPVPSRSNLLKSGVSRWQCPRRRKPLSCCRLVGISGHSFGVFSFAKPAMRPSAKMMGPGNRTCCLPSSHFDDLIQGRSAFSSGRAFSSPNAQCGDRGFGNTRDFLRNADIEL